MNVNFPADGGLHPERVAAPSPGGGATRGQGLAPLGSLDEPRRLLVGAAAAAPTTQM